MTLIERSSEHSTAKTTPQKACDELDLAILRTVTYADIFDYPLTNAEIRRYLIGVNVPQRTVDLRLNAGWLVPRYLSNTEGFFTLCGREGIVHTRQQRQELAVDVWPRAISYGQLIASLPFVKLVAVTGELAMDNTGPRSDIDYFIVTEPRRLWLCRLMVIGVVKYVARRGDIVCPNFLLSESSLVLDDRNLYTAHEVTQMIPMTGHASYEQFRALNPWVYDYLPNATGAPRAMIARPHGRRVRLLAESVLRTRFGARLERWEMNRKIRKLRQVGSHSNEASFTEEWCKGHVDDHGERIIALYTSRWDTVEGLLE